MFIIEIMLSPVEHKIKKLEAMRELSVRQSEESLAGFIRHGWNLVEKKRDYQHNWHIDAISEHLEAVFNREIRNLIINIPPRHMKSLGACVFFPAWIWGPKRTPGECFLFGSYSPKLASRDSTKCRRIIRSPWYLDHWSDSFIGDEDDAKLFKKTGSVIRQDQDEKMRFENITGGTRISTSTGGTGTGDGGDIIVVDDPHKVKGVESKVMREGVLEWWDDEMSTRGNDPKTVCRIVIMQRVHEQDLCGHILESEMGYDHLCLPFEYEGKEYSFPSNTQLGFKDPRKKPGDRLWPSRFDDAATKDLTSKMTATAQAGQLQQRPTPKDGVIIKRKFFDKRWTTLPEKFDKIIDAWDLTFGSEENENGAFNVGYKLGLKFPDVYVIEESRFQGDILRQLKEIPKLRATDAKTRKSVVENAANGKATVQTLKKKIPGLRLITPRGSKEDRAESVKWVMEEGNVLFPADHVRPWAKSAIDEMVTFGPKARFKDRVDALVHGLAYFEPDLERKLAQFGSVKKLSQWALG